LQTRSSAKATVSRHRGAAQRAERHARRRGLRNPECGNSLSNNDFQGISGTLSFAAGETAKTVRVNLLQVATYDSGELEHFRFNLSSPINATLATSSAMISIVDNDTIVATPGLFVRDVIVDEKAG
jgi:hypothetical protein